MIGNLSKPTPPAALENITRPDVVQAGHTVGGEFLPALDQAKQVLGQQLDLMPGLLRERKKFAIAIPVATAACHVLRAPVETRRFLLPLIPLRRRSS